MSLFQSIILGIVQGLTEFLPVSSSGHLALVQQMMAIDPESPTVLLFDVVTHVGTLLAVGVVFFIPFTRYIRGLVKEVRPGYAGKRYALHVTLIGVCASIPTAGIGLGFRDFLARAFGEPIWIAVGLLVTGILLQTMRWIPRPTRGWKRFGVGRAVVVGIAQGLAIMPGISRSGATICTAELLGIKRTWAAQFSFLIAAPAILGATAIQTRHVFGIGLDGISLAPILVGGLVSFVVGYAALRMLLSAVRRAKLHWFSYYCWFAAVVVLACCLR